MSSKAVNHVSDTAFMVAVFRAQESERPDALFRDPWAARLAGERGREIVSALPKQARMMSWSVIVRTQVIDRMIVECASEGIDLVLNLGAGLDTRPYRLELPPSLAWIEVDHAEVIDFKERELAGEQPRCQLERVRLDLADAAARGRLWSELAARFSKVLVLTEGVIIYLSEEQVGTLASELRAQPSFAYWLTDYFSPRIYRQRRRGLEHVLKSSPFQFEPKDYFGFFRAHGFREKRARYLAEEAEPLGRPAPLPVYARALFRLLGRFMPPEQKQQLKRFMGYILFEQAPHPLEQAR